MKCPNCENEIIQTKGKRKKLFCNSTCRSNVWAKSKRKQIVKPNKAAQTDSKVDDKQELPKIEARIAKIEELLLAPPKYLPSYKRTPLESELSKLQFQLAKLKSN